MASVWSIRRSVDDAKLAGLCGGVARHWGIDPLLVRVGWVLLALSGGLGVVLYVAGWLLVPADGEARSTLDNLTGGATGRWSREARIAIVVVACIVVFAITGSIFPFGFWPAIVITLIWYFGYYRQRARRPAPPVSGAPPPAVQPAPQQPFRYPGPTTPFTQAAQAWQQRMAEHLGHQPPTAPLATPSPSSPPSTPPRTPTWPAMPSQARSPIQDPPNISVEDAEHAAYLSVPDPVGLYAEQVPTGDRTPSRRTRAQAPAARRLRLVGLIVLGLTLSGLALANTLGAHVTALGFLAASLLVIGLTLIVATWVGRARGILPLGVIVAVALLVVGIASPGGVPRDWTRTSSYATVADLPTRADEFEIGMFTVDLRDLAVSKDVTYTAHVDVGRLVVHRPESGNVRIRYAVQQGVAVVDGDPVASGNRQGVIEPTDPIAGRPTLTLDLSADVGEVRVER